MCLNADRLSVETFELNSPKAKTAHVKEIQRIEGYGRTFKAPVRILSPTF